MSVLVPKIQEPAFPVQLPYLGLTLQDVKGFIRAVGQGELIGAVEQLEEFKKASRPSFLLKSELRHAEALLEIQLFFTGIKKTATDLWQEEEEAFLAYFGGYLDLPCPEIKQAADQTLRYLQMKKTSEEVRSAVEGLQIFSKKVVDLQKESAQLSSEEIGLLEQELDLLKGRFSAYKWSGKEQIETQIDALKKVLPTLKCSTMKSLIGWICSILFPPAPRALAALPAAIAPIGIRNEGSSCFLASAVQLILKDPILEEALIQEWVEGGDAREFGEFLFNYKEARASGGRAVAGVGKLREALCRLSGNDAFSSGQWDANEVLRTLVSDEKSSLYQRLQEKGYFIAESVRRYYAPPAGSLPIEGGDLLLDPQNGLYYSERSELRPAQIEVELSASDEGKNLADLVAQVWRVSLEESEPGSYLMQDFQEQPCRPIFQWTVWNSPVPERVTVSLKRWAYAGAGVKVDAPVVVSEIEPIQVGNELMNTRLIGFTLHSGNTGGGHWISFTAENGVYTCNDDSQVYEISKEAFLLRAQKASDLYFERV